MFASGYINTGDHFLFLKYYTKTNLNTERKQVEIFQAKQFLVLLFLIASSLDTPLPRVIHSSVVFEHEYHVMGGNSMIN